MSEKFEGATPPQESEEIMQEEIKRGSMVGLSLSLCVRDILRGEIKLEEVVKIIAGTDASREEWGDLMNIYRQTCWRKNPDKGVEKIAWSLLKAGKIEQPRQEGKEPHSIAGGHWKKLTSLLFGKNNNWIRNK